MKSLVHVALRTKPDVKLVEIKELRYLAQMDCEIDNDHNPVAWRPYDVNDLVIYGIGVGDRRYQVIQYMMPIYE